MRIAPVTVALLLAGPAYAFPDGAPWGAADPEAEETCSSCHFDNDVVLDSEAIGIEGLPERFTPGEVYELVLKFTAPEASTAGFLISATEGSDFMAVAENTERNKNEIRSTAPLKNDSGASWKMEWRAPGATVKEVMFYIAANAANNDASSFGDHIHYRKIIVLAN